ncbi:alpha-glucuronidase family glycosyl hydrolase [Neolewinella lacunae]|uniref:Xylan alpha-1,2-glucuronidase n=1 Tax=Neolewinella lacunae TaxID=1517758 RepID=A0A923PJ32_9BACT|nr:alpha-glucuronidase family glycosyl hydrolase [Neolewinella lacunae]MBC6995010.1 alpha-glucuronidase [Neolewinella lacunae]MDN3633219.1 alpha-glucuronidase family glycosyl hydrolase [Neolewinella lacunae]
MRAFFFLLTFLCSLALCGADGYQLWLRHRLIEDPTARQQYQRALSFVDAAVQGPTGNSAVRELRSGLTNLLGTAPATSPAKKRSQGIYLGLRQSSSRIRQYLQSNAVEDLGPEGYHLASYQGDVLLIADQEQGLLYGVFDLLRAIQTGEDLTNLQRTERPAYQYRILNHWDNLDGTVERGYAGFSIWNWHQLPEFIDQRYVDYARACASVGINGTVVTNVNANSLVFRADYLEKAAALADVFRPYGIKLYLTARFSSPVELGGLPTADPLDPQVIAWWKSKAAEIYARIPDFGGFVVKANSEGQPGPREYGRSHAEGANVLADALAPHGGIVVWRAFVYTDKAGGDRFREAYDEFTPLDGAFRKNVLLQIKNGPIDFQPREPVSPLFAAMPQTPLLLEFQITKEYLGQGTHLVGMASLYTEVLGTDLAPNQAGGEIREYITGMAGVSNIGTARNWTGNLFGQADWYAFGRLSWGPELPANTIFREWAKLTFGPDPTVVTTVTELLEKSYPACVNYMTPLGLHHIMATGHHYGPGPWIDDLERDDWNPYYYHGATRDSVGFDRKASGSKALAQYPAEFARQFLDPTTCPPEFLLWFHRLPWTFALPNGNSLWQELGLSYQRGVDQVAEMQTLWASLENRVDRERHLHVSQHLAIQAKEARWWRDACLAYFSAVSGLPIPAGVTPPKHSLEYYRSLVYPYAPGIRPQW